MALCSASETPEIRPDSASRDLQMATWVLLVTRVAIDSRRQPSDIMSGGLSFVGTSGRGRPSRGVSVTAGRHLGLQLSDHAVGGDTGVIPMPAADRQEWHPCPIGEKPLAERNLL